MMKTHQKELKTLAKNADPFDYNDGLRLFIEHLRWMKDYYALGENVWAMEEEGEPTRLESLTEALRHYDAWQNAEDKYIKVVELDHDAENGKFSYRFEYLLGDREETYKAMNAEQEQERALFFSTLAQYLESWWD